MRYEDTLDRNVLPLETQLLNPAVAGKLSKYRDIIELEGEDRKVLRSMIEMAGKWITYTDEPLPPEEAGPRINRLVSRRRVRK